MKKKNKRVGDSFRRTNKANRRNGSVEKDLKDLEKLRKELVKKEKDK